MYIHPNLTAFFIFIWNTAAYLEAISLIANIATNFNNWEAAER